jgi:hypothetical protein
MTEREYITDWAMTGFVLAIILLSIAYAFGAVPTVIILTIAFANDWGRWYSDNWWQVLALIVMPGLMLLGGLFGLLLARDGRF